jgi:tetratricopeptide (TPR) repeat protein
MMAKEQNSKKWFDNGLALKFEGKYPASIKAFTLAIENNSEFGKAYFERAVCYYKLGSYLKAKSDLKAATVLGCEEAQFWIR